MNLRPSGYEPDELPGCSTPRRYGNHWLSSVDSIIVNWGNLGRPGNDLLSRALRHSTIGAEGFHGRVRDGIGCRLPAMATRSSNPPPVVVTGKSPGDRVVNGSGAAPGINQGICCVCVVRPSRSVSGQHWRRSGDDFHAWCWISSRSGD